MPSRACGEVEMSKAAVWNACWCSITMLLGSAASGCTFYTSCPTDNGNNNGNTAGTNGGGGGNVNPGTTIVDGNIPDGEWLNVTPELPADLKDMCGPIFFLGSYPTHDETIAGVFNRLWSTKDGGASWEPLGQGEGSMPPNNRAQQIIFDPEAPDTYWEAGIYGGGVFKTTDAGSTFELLGDSDHVDSIAIDLSDPDRQTMLSSGHETQLVRKSEDGGATWTDISETLPEAKWCRNSLIFDAQTYLLGCGGGFNMIGKPSMLRTTDGGESWTKVYDDGGGSIPLVHSDGSIYWPLEATHGLARSTDQGETWQAKPQYDLQPVTPVELPDGRLASISQSRVVVSDDAGKTWKNVTPKTPWVPVGFTYNTFQKAFFIFYFACRSTSQGSAGDEIFKFDFDYEKY
jgi:photosystem II stability/assembly factor-like uncharacterized protein